MNSAEKARQALIDDHKGGPINWNINGNNPDYLNAHSSPKIIQLMDLGGSLIGLADNGAMYEIIKNEWVLQMAPLGSEE